MSAYDDLQERLRQIAKESGDQFRTAAAGETVKMVVPQNRNEDHVYRRSWLQALKQLDGRSFELLSIEAHEDPRVPIVLHFPDMAERQKFSDVLQSGELEVRALQMKAACEAYLENKQDEPAAQRFEDSTIPSIIRAPVIVTAANEP